MPRTRPPYPAAFRAEAVELSRTSGKTIPELAKDLGVSGQGQPDAALGQPVKDSGPKRPHATKAARAR